MTQASQAHAFEPTWESLQRYRVPQWYQDAKFGIFIHWGVFSVPAFANEWYPRNMYIEGTPEFAHHRATYGPQTRFGYKSLGSGSELPGERIAAISLLGTDEQLHWSQHEHGLTSRTPARRPCEHAYSFKIRLNT